MFRLVKYVLYIFIAVGLFYFLQDILDNSSSVRRNVQSSIIRISNTAKQMLDTAYENIMNTTDNEINQTAEQAENMLAQASN
ncbi:MAG: hypothetical protein IJ099_02645 [Alphaproteobacteria bacterium]|nr:hypothetical protein [Alphaproteobacteria bacterium]